MLSEEHQMKAIDSYSKRLTLLSAMLLSAGVVAGCGGSSSSVPPPGGASLGPVGGVCAGASCVNLGKAANYVILAKTGVSTVPNSVVTGNIGLSPASRTFLTGWSQTADVTDTYATSAQVAAPGKLYAADNVGGTTSVDLTTAVGDMQTAYTNANGMAPAGGALAGGVPGTACPGTGGTGALAGMTITPGVYTCTVALDIAAAGTLTLSGAGVYVIRTSQALTTGTTANVVLSNGALAKNVFWVVAGASTIGANAHLEGILLDQTAINMGNLSSINGRLLAQTAVNLNATTVTIP
jgi:hypothetical protein